MTMRTEIALLLLMILLARSRGSNKCLQPLDRGRCDNYVSKYYYNKSSEKCLHFWYGSCGGNANRFDSLELCHQACITGRQDQDDTDDSDRNEIPESQILLEITDNVISPVSDLCQLPKDSGPCTEYTGKWFFNSTLQDCSRFWYGSCQGNDNRFDDRETCRRRCIKEANTGSLPVNTSDNTRQHDKPTTVCEQPKDAGTCREYVAHWYFDENVNACHRFWYGGCGGNSNRFSSKEECEAKCVKSEHQASTVRPAQPAVGCAHSKYGCCPDQQTSAEGPNYKGCTENCEDFIYGCCPDGVTQPQGPNQDGCEIGSGNVPCEQTKHGCCADGITTASGRAVRGCADTPYSERTPVGAQVKSTAASPEKKCTAPVSKHKCKEFEVKWRFDGQECVRHWWGGCSGTGNVFDSKEACNTECKGTVVKTLIPSVSPKQAACTAPESIVLCAEKFTVKWRFNNTQQKCVRHWWGGCGDNGNVFESEDDCEAVCMNTVVITNPDTVDPDFVTFCDMEVDAGPCTDNIPRYYYDPRNRKCKIFYYGGCQGNENNFAGIEECQRQCMGGVSHTATSAAIPKQETSTYVTAAIRTTAGPDKNVRSSIKMSGQSTAERGSTIHIRCNAVGPAQPTEIEWYFNQRLITADDTDVSITTIINHQLKQALVSELVIMNFDQENAGTYYCRSRPYGDLEKMRITIVEERVTPESTDRRDPTAVCLMKAESGNCYASIPRYHYDHQSGHCLQFIYGGCGGNQNNFETLQECSHFCSDKEVCHQPREVGRCRAAHPRFYFDSQTRSCQNFIYGGCDGNLNNFATKEACDKKCHHYKHSSSHTDAAITNEDKDPNVCQLKPEQGTCRGYEIKWYYIPDRNRCARFVYTGCGGNGNQFNSQEECSSKCLKVENTDNRDSWRQTVPSAPTRQSTVFYPKSSSAPRGAGQDYELVLAKLGDTAVLTCSLRSVGVLWYRDGLLLSSSSKIHVYNNGTLYLRSVTEDMAGLYNCRIISGNNVQQVEKFRVQVYVPPKIVPAPDLVSMMPGKDVFVHCQAVGTPDPVVSWNRGGRALRTSDRYSVFANGTLIIHKVHIQDAGEYECSADNGIAATSKTFRLSIKETISADIQSHRGIYAEGETIELHCKGTGYPTPKLEWVKEGKELTSGGTISSINGILTVTSATIEDAGMYKCIAFNEKGKAEDSTVVQIRLHNPLMKCEDSLGRTRCHLIVTGRLCGFRHFATHCCRSCRKAGFM